MMPVMDGFETLAAIRRDPALRDLHVVVVTAKDLTDAERATLEGRADILLEKATVPIDRLAGVVEGVLRGESRLS
jgi:CheY-like chemotaxis protein